MCVWLLAAKQCSISERLPGQLIYRLLLWQPLMTVSTLQATRRKQGQQQADEENLVVPVKRRKGTFADIAEVRCVNQLWLQDVRPCHGASVAGHCLPLLS